MDLGGAYFIIVLVIIGWVLGIVLPPLTAWNKAKYTGMWAGPNTARYRWKGYWWGYNKNTKSAFIIYNGPKMNFQVQTWRPRFAVWGVFKHRRARIGWIQWIAIRYCLPAGDNTWYGPDVSHPYNINVWLEKNVSVAVGAMKLKHLIRALQYAREDKVTQPPRQAGRGILAKPPAQTFYCECNSFECEKQVAMTTSEYLAIMQRGGHVIANTCKTGPTEHDTVIEKRRGYMVVKEPNFDT